MQDDPLQPVILTFAEARHRVEHEAALLQATELESVDLLSAPGRVIGERVLADRDFPPFPRSTRDGYAVRSADLSSVPAILRVIGEIRAGQQFDSIPANIESGQAVSIMTGAPVPTGTDTVVMVEDTVLRGQQVGIMRQGRTGENIVPRGAEARAGGVLVDQGARLCDSTIALAASTGKSALLVHRRPVVAVLATGDEIVQVDAFPGPTQIRNSNSFSLAAQITSAGGNPLLLPIAPDEPSRLRSLILEGLKADLLILSGGVSMGRYDLVEAVLSDLKAEFFFTGAKIQPGRPIVFGRCAAGDQTLPGRKGHPRRHTYFFGLPGNPVSTMVTFELFVRPMVEALSGESPQELRFVYAPLKAEVRVKPGLTRFLPAILSGEFEDSHVELVPWQGSGDIAATARANCYLVISPDREKICPGEFIPVILR